ANIKERRDCSTALFDERGRMIAQAEHIPVHLGALPDAVAAVREHDPGPDDVFVLHDPPAGGPPPPPPPSRSGPAPPRAPRAASPIPARTPSSSSTTRTRAARTCPTSRWSRER